MSLKIEITEPQNYTTPPLSYFVTLLCLYLWRSSHKFQSQEGQLKTRSPQQVACWVSFLYVSLLFSIIELQFREHPWGVCYVLYFSYLNNLFFSSPSKIIFVENHLNLKLFIYLIFCYFSIFLKHHVDLFYCSQPYVIMAFSLSNFLQT